ncbi:hypothetical protein ACCP16_13800 [Xanthomonas citri pv. malvacearum]|uniref:hypothetical protein n=1 Tax=Xanthomonas citri TaxID=346 RepID=UPI0003F75E6D|nr:hypothetical protein [Xanthomonas citri]ASY88984.1 hypothetical protein CIW72_11990 [Xanthomonas citri pv. malvacearum]ASY88994.1 hypothetical protein CIW72_12040 [Xanthomonas citri pv. malvacearum]
MSKLKTLFAQAAAITSTALVAPMAFAGEMSEAVSSGVDKTELTAIGVIVLSVAGIILLIRSGKKSAS